MKFKNKTVIVTGGGSGIGRELVLQLLARGANVAATDINEKSLAETAKIANAGDRLSIHAGDTTDREAVGLLPKAVLAHHGVIDVLINNAGVIQPFVNFNDLDFKVIDRMMSINLMGAVNMSKAFLPYLLERPEAHLANVSSMGALIPFPGQTVYSAAKAAVKLFTEGLYAELLDTNVGVSLVIPGAVATNIMENSGVEMPGASGDSDAAMAAAPADLAARIILDGIEADRLHIFIGKDSKTMNMLSKIAPRWSIGYIQKKMKQM